MISSHGLLQAAAAAISSTDDGQNGQADRHHEPTPDGEQLAERGGPERQPGQQADQRPRIGVDNLGEIAGCEGEAEAEDGEAEEAHGGRQPEGAARVAGDRRPAGRQDTQRLRAGNRR